MGFGGIGPGSLVIILLIVILLFGTKKFRNIGSDIGGAFRNFKKAVKDDDPKKEDADATTDSIEQKEANVIDAEVTKVEEKEKQ
ncbi:Twin-arginine translocation protein TatA [hydrothermal vent metagenome]|uniref:Twin-arginine translocation protein TatA n=1 Tax=hydrothermal vent metagenome TaxID=652676 RepID=A0A3B1A5V0_9ZZZZ